MKSHLRANRGIRLATLVLYVLVGLACAQQTRPDVAKDTFAGVERIVAVGDVHGDFAQFEKVLRAAGVVDRKNDWAAGKTHLVQTGDVLDRGPDSRKVMDLLMKLEAQAAQAGGAVHCLIGNHEAMVLLGYLGYADPGELKAFGGEEELRKAMGPEGKYGRWIRGHNAVLKLNDLLFAHAGITSAVAGMSLAQINKSVRDSLAKGDGDSLAIGLGGPLWDRTLALGEEAAVAKALDQVLKRYQAARMVIGHTVSADGIATRADGRLVRIDVGMSAMFGGPAACLLVEEGVFYEVTAKSKRDLKLAAQLVPASKPATTQD